MPLVDPTLEGIHSEAARGEMCIWVLTGEGSLDGGQESTKVGGGSPSLHVDVNRAEGHSSRVLGAVVVWAQGGRGGWLGPLGLQLPPRPHFPGMR